MKFDLSKFKKFSSEHKHTTLVHPDGHKITINHAVLSPKMRANLASLPEYKEPSSELPETKLAKGGAVPEDRKYVDGGDVAPVDMDPNAPEVADLTQQTPPTDTVAESPESAPAQPGEAMAANVPTDQTPGPAFAEKPEEPKLPAEGGAPSILGGFQKSMSGIVQGAKAQEQLAAKQAVASDQQTEALKAAAEKEQAKEAFTDEHIRKFLDDKNNGHIDPDRLWNNKSLPGKIKSTIGLILGGIGSGMTGQPNLAAQFLQKAIERDVEAQQADFNNKNTLYHANLQALGNARDAYNVTVAQLGASTASDMRTQALKTGGPMAAAEANRQAGALETGIAPGFIQAQINQQLIKASSAPNSGDQMEQLLPTLRVTMPEKAKEIEEHMIPGVGTTQVPVDAKTRGEITGRVDLQNQLSNLNDWAKKHSGSLSPAEQNYGATLAKSVQDAYRRANGQGVFREAEAKFVNQMIAEDPTAFFYHLRTEPKYKAALLSNGMALQGLYKQVGLKPKAGGSASPAPFTPKTFKPIQ